MIVFRVCGCKDLKVSHICPQEVTALIEFLKEKYGDDNGKVKVTHGKVHDYLGMVLDYSILGEVQIKMIDNNKSQDY